VNLVLDKWLKRKREEAEEGMEGEEEGESLRCSKKRQGTIKKRERRKGRRKVERKGRMRWK